MKSLLTILTLLLLVQVSCLGQEAKDSQRHKTDTAHLSHQNNFVIPSPKTADTSNADNRSPRQLRHSDAAKNLKTASAVNEQKTQIPVLQDSTAASATGTVLSRATDMVKDSARADSARAIVTSAMHIPYWKILSRNKYIDLSDAPVYFLQIPRKPLGKEFLFYTLCGVLLILGIFRSVFSGYFKNLFRVYFNTSLRQTQLADQLEQAKLPSLILNIFFAITGGIYIWLLFGYYHPPRLVNPKMLLPACILVVGTLYFVKFCLLKFIGWVSAIQQNTNKYIFAIFLVNKIIGVVLVPIVIVLAFSNPGWRTVVTNGSFFLIGLFFLSRYFKSYGALDKKVRINPLHFAIYIAAAEILPLFLLYKVAVDYFI